MKFPKTLRFTSLFLILTFIFSFFSFSLTAAAANSVLEDFWVDASNADAASYTDGRNATDLVHWWKNEADGKYYLFLPNSADLSNLTVYFTANNIVRVGKNPLTSGEKTSLFANGGEFRIICGTINYNIVIQRSSKIPSMFISTESGNVDSINANKDYKEKGKMLLVESDGTSVSYNGDLLDMKGRGNITWTYPKRPYNIKLAESTNLLGMGKSKSWCLIANWVDQTQLHDKIAYDLAEEAGIDFISHSQHVDLYINNVYAGLYVLTESLDVDNDSVDIENLEKATETANENADLSTFTQGGTSGFVPDTYKYYNIPKDPDDITGGYFLEYDLDIRYEEGASGFVTSKGQSVILKSPEFASKKQVEYIRDFVQDMEDAIYSDTGKNKKGKYYTDYIDIDSFAKMYLAQEYCMNLDVGITSFFLYKDSDTAGDGKIHAAPIWDFDNAFGIYGPRDGVDLNDPEVFWANKGRIYDSEDWTPHIMNALYQHQDFDQKVTREWYKSFVPVIDKLAYADNQNQTKVVKHIEEYQDQIEDSALMDEMIWPDAPKIADSFDEAVADLTSFLQKREAFLTRSWKADLVDLEIQGIDKATGEKIYSQNLKVVASGEENIKAPSIENYKLDSDSSKKQTVTINSAKNTAVFYYNKDVPTLETEKHIQYINGYDDGTFRPDNAISRAEAAAIFWRLVTDKNKDDQVDLSMQDISNDVWYAQAVKYLASKNILKGYDDGTFRPDQTVTRAEFAAIASRFDKVSTDGSSHFTDVPSDHWAASYINNAFTKGWISGYPGDEFRPDNSITRAEAVKIINSILSRKLKEDNVPAELQNKYSDISSEHWAFADIIEASTEHEYTRDENGAEIWKQA